MINYHPSDFLIDAYFYLVAKKLNFKIIRFNVNFNKKKEKYGKGSSDNIFKKIKGGVEHIIGAIKILFKSIFNVFKFYTDCISKFIFFKVIYFVLIEFNFFCANLVTQYRF